MDNLLLHPFPIIDRRIERKQSIQRRSTPRSLGRSKVHLLDCFTDQSADRLAQFAGAFLERLILFFR